MFHIVYVSTAIRAFSAHELRAFAADCSIEKYRSRVTGMLVYSSGQFLQSLEGEPSEVIATYDRISTDPRHDDLTVLLRGLFANQRFARWAMGFHADEKSLDQVSVSDRIKLRSLDEVSATDFLSSCNRMQEP